MSEPIQARFFLVGCPRSGTTLLQSLLAAHSQIASFPESHLLLAGGGTRWGRLMTKLGVVTPAMRTRLALFLGELNHPELLASFPPYELRLRTFVNTFVAMLDQLTTAQGKTIWLEKTPLHLLYVKQFEQYIPGVKFIHLLRNGADVVASLVDVTNRFPAQWGGAYGIERAIRLWNLCVTETAAQLGKANHLALRYETLIANPEQRVGQLCEFIGVPFEAAMLRDNRQTSTAQLVVNEPWKRNAFQPIQATGQQKFLELFTPAEQSYIVQSLRDLPCL